MTPATVAPALLLALALAAAGCRSGSGDPAPGPDAGGAGHAGKYGEADAPPPPTGPDPAALRTVRSEPVVGFTGSGGAPFEVALRTMDAPAPIARRIGTRTFRLGLRTDSPELGQHPCTSCHVAPAQLAPERVEDAHRNLEALHPTPAEGRCSTCHAPEVQLLRLQSGETVTLDHAYRLCAQCHFQQVGAWAAGAHGKRLDGWLGRRVVMPCAECHDPHRPTLEQRIPFRPPVLPRAGGSRP